MDSELLEIAAHRLNSINPAPEDLPDLLDGLLVSQTRINERIVLSGRMVSNLTKQIGLVHSRLTALNKANPELYRRSVPISDLANQDDGYRIYRTQSLLLQHIINQLAFISWKFGENFKGQLDRLTTAHHRIFLEFLGYRHEHAGDDGAYPDEKRCVDGCDWYSRVGSYEWSKQAYSTGWWKEMNNTTWDWIRVREHIKNMVFDAWKVVMSIDMCHSNVKRFVPAWVWYESPKMWGLKAELVLPQDHSSKGGKCEIRLQVRFVKNEQMKQYERALLEQQQRQKWIQEGMSYAEAATKPVNVEVKPIGVQYLDWAIAFDGPAVAPDWNRGGQHTSLSSWLNWWGFRKWLEEQAKRKEASSKSESEIQTG